MNRRVRIAFKTATVLVLVLIFLGAIALVTLSSPWFHEKVRQEIISELERVTGGTATLGSWVANWRLLTVEFTDLTLHGTEPAGVAPLLQARSTRIGLKIVSFWKKNVDIQSLAIAEPRVNILVAADGSTNIPHPKIPSTSGKIGLEPLLDWKIGKLSLDNGTVLFAEKKYDMSLRGENLRAQFSYDSGGPRYQGQLSMQPLRIEAPAISPVTSDVYLTLGLEKNRIAVSNAKFDMGGSHVEASGAIENLSAPELAFQFTAHAVVDQVAAFFRIRAVRQGTIDLAGSMNYKSSSAYNVSSIVNARGLDVSQDRIRVRNARGTARVTLNPRGMEVAGISLDALGGHFTGKASFPELKRFTVDGTARDFPIQQALSAFVPDLPPAGKTTWSGVASGPIHVEGAIGSGAVVVAGQIAIEPAPGGIPIQGTVDARYDGRARTLNLNQSFFLTPGARVDLSGVLGSQLQVKLTSTNLNELLPVINAFSTSRVDSLPVQLKNGKATFDGTVTGSLSSPVIAGAVSANSFQYAGIDLDAFSGQVKLNESSLEVRDGKLSRGAAGAQIVGTVGLNDWKAEDSSAIAATATVAGADLTELLNLAGQKEVPVSGALAVSARVTGTVGTPQGSADITVTKGVAYDEPFDRLQGTVTYSSQAINISQFRLTAGPAQITGSGSFEPSVPFRGVPELRDGRAQFQLTTNEMAVQRFENMKRRRPGVSGMAQATLQGSAAIQKGGSPQVILTALDGSITTQGLRMDNRAIGNLKVTAKTEASVLKIQLASDFLNSNLVVNGQWKLIPGYPGEASAHFSQVSLGTVRDWLAKTTDQSGLNFDGSAEGVVSISGPALDPSGWKASAQLTNFELHPREQGVIRPRRFDLRNDGPVVLTMERSVVNISNAHFVGPSTDVHVTGTAAVDPKPSLDLRVNGDVNLGVIQNFTPDLETEGAVALTASVRGSPDQPQVNGRLEVKRGSIHFLDTPTGLSAANGTILFSGNQATIQDFTGTVGGGRVDLGGVIGYSRGELSYRIDAKAADVRVRYPEGASTSANAQLTLRGTSQRSTLSGSITVVRTGFNPRTDFSSILGKASQPVRTPSARVGPLSGMHFDIRIETAPDISFESSLTQDLQVEGNLKLQGTPYNPVLLGRLNITQGEINFFGTKYTINQGSVAFSNPVKMEPVVNVDLETRVQGIDVILTISGPITNMVVTPRSDPPLEYSQVLSLLATGSAPTSDPTLAARQNQTSQSFTQLGASALIGQVVANPVSSRLQRFFGVSKLKIDPQLTGVENNPQARLTLEQQVSKNLTFTYITNLNSSNQQIVRVEWALSRQFSVIAVRDDNGLFGIDFLYKKSFK